MAPKDFFHLNEKEYAIRISQYDDDHLKRQEIVKTRQIVAAFWSIGSGSVGAAFTHGATLVVSIYGVRRAHVAIRKVIIIKKRLMELGIELHKLEKYDYIIPLIAGMIGTAIGLGVDFGIAAMVPTDHLLVSIGSGHPGDVSNSIAFAPSGSSLSHAGLAALPQGHEALLPPFHPSTGNEIAAAFQHPGSVFHGLGEGIAAQGHAEVLAMHHVPGVNIADSVAPSGNDTLSNALGVLFGANLTVSAQHTLFAFTGAQLAWWVTEKFDSDVWIPRMAKQLGCSRLAWSFDVTCDICTEPIKNGLYYHCCECGNDEGGDEEFDMCPSCHQIASEKPPDYDGIQQPPHEHDLSVRQVAVCGDAFYPDKTKALLRGWSAWNVLKTPYKCNSCTKDIRQGWYYHCATCHDGTFDLCLPCYKRGRHCDDETAHLLYAFVRADVAKYDAKPPYADKSCYAKCTGCFQTVTQGVFYHCRKCDGGELDLCSQCYEIGGRCSDSAHVLTRYNAWLYLREPPRAENGMWKCDVPGCVSRERETFFSCGECDDGAFVICQTCYYTGAGCRDRRHDMLKYVFRT